MKTAFFIASLLLSTAAHAETKDVTDDDLCKALGSLSAKIMEMRQTETPLSRALEISGEGENSKLTRQIVMKAYEQPAFQTPKNQKQAVASFRNQIELDCFKAANK